jgi:ABC-2 type transport system permease protein
VTTPPAATGTPRAGRNRPTIGVRQSVWLVAQREITVKLRSKAFLISTGILMLIALASVVSGGIFGGTSTAPKVAATSAVAAQLSGVPGLEVTTVDSEAAAEALVRDGTVSAAILANTAANQDAGSSVILPFKIVALDSAPAGVVNLLSVSPTVELLEPSPNSPLLIYFVAIGFGLVFFMSAMTFGTTIAQSVVEEKQTRVVEILMSTIPVRVLMAGKVLGNSILAFAQILVIALLVGIGLTATGQHVLFASLGPSIVWFVIFFAFGFVLIAALYAATASLVSRQEDVGSATSPVMMLVMLPYILVIIFNNNPVVLGVMSYIPFSAPVGMPMRLFLGTAQWWEPLLSLVILLATTTVVILAGAKIYSNSILRTGSRIKLTDALRGR